jgi:hypothetical protein
MTNSSLGGLLVTDRRRASLTFTGIVVGLALCVGGAGAVLWLRLYAFDENIRAAAPCVARILIAPVATLFAAVFGLSLVRRATSIRVMLIYWAFMALLLYFATYAALFLSWAIRVWPDQCICAC